MKLRGSSEPNSSASQFGRAGLCSGRVELVSHPVDGDVPQVHDGRADQQDAVPGHPRWRADSADVTPSLAHDFPSSRNWEDPARFLNAGRSLDAVVTALAESGMMRVRQCLLAGLTWFSLAGACTGAPPDRRSQVDRSHRTDPRDARRGASRHHIQRQRGAGTGLLRDRRRRRRRHHRRPESPPSRRPISTTCGRENYTGYRAELDVRRDGERVPGGHRQSPGEQPRADPCPGTQLGGAAPTIPGQHRHVACRDQPCGDTPGRPAMRRAASNCPTPPTTPRSPRRSARWRPDSVN